MKTKKAVCLLLCGTILGISLALCIGAAEKPAKDWSRLKIVSYPASTTGIFDPDTGKVYFYDVNLLNCYAIRELTVLGEPTIRRKN